jgi:hypothetical protein
MGNTTSQVAGERQIKAVNSLLIEKAERTDGRRKRGNNFS